MKPHKSIRSFIGAKDFEESKAFYIDFGFSELSLVENLSYFSIDESLGFYLQKAYVKDWVDNSMLFLEVEDTISYRKMLKDKDLSKYENVRISKIENRPWGKVFFLHDPSNILWQIGEFYN